MKKHIYNIKNPIAYFKKAQWNRNADEFRKEKKHRENNIHISEIFPNENSLDFLNGDTDNNDNEESNSILSPRLWGIGDFDRVENEYKYDGSLHWIDLIHNSKLHKVIENLTDEEKIFISLIFYEQKTQDELAELYEINQSSIFYRINKILRKIKIFMSRK